MKRKSGLIFALLLMMSLVIFAMSSCSNPCKDGHLMDDRWITYDSPTCKKEGVDVKVCLRCGEILESKSLDKVDHVAEEWKIVRESTCIEEGIKQKKCKYCDVVLETKTIKLESHVNGEWVTLFEETCDSAGRRACNCVNCGIELDFETIEPHHIIIDLDAVEPTCIKEGLTKGSKCSRCSTIITVQEPIEKKEHNWVDDPYKAPTCAAYGYTEGSHCSYCKEWKVKPEKIEKLPHTPVDDPRVEPTHAKTGLTAGSHCKVCRQTIVKQNTIPAIGHTFDILTNKCSCGTKQYTEINSYKELEALAGDRTINEVVYNIHNIGFDPNVFYTFTFDPTIKYVRFVGEPNRVYSNFNFVFSERNNDLRIDFVNFRLEISKKSNVPITVNGEVNVTIGMYGTTCSIKAPTGSHQREWARACDGDVAVSAPKASLKLIIGTTETSYIIGGDGENGSSTIPGFKTGGGNGAVALEANKIVVYNDKGDSALALTIMGGKGGKTASIVATDGTSGDPANVTITYK